MSDNTKVNKVLEDDYRVAQQLIGKKFRHYKGNIYRVACVGIHTDNIEVLVGYHALKDSSLIWFRPFSQWFEIVNYKIDETRMSSTRRFVPIKD